MYTAKAHPTAMPRSRKNRPEDPECGGGRSYEGMVWKLNPPDGEKEEERFQGAQYISKPKHGKT